MSTTVVYFSTCALDHAGNLTPFSAQEMPWLLSHFDRVVLCDRRGVAEVTQAFIEPIEVIKPAMGTLHAVLRLPFCTEFWREMSHLRKDRKGTFVNVGKLLAFTVRGLQMANWASAMLHPEEQTTLYSFWMSYDGFATALIKRRHPNMRAIARGHAFDIDRARNPMNPYLMKRFMGETLDGLYPISGDAKARMLDCAPLPENKITVLGIGSAGSAPFLRFPSPVLMDGVFRLVSCATILPLKRLPLLIDALEQWEGRLRWTHLGGGRDEASLRAYAAQKLGHKPNIEFEITGVVPPERVRLLYSVQPFDAFVNTSASEGTPVSIMEAMRAGMPIVAPAIGGIPELVDDQIGRLFPVDGGAAAVLQALQSIYALTPEQTEAMRATSQARWSEHCQSERLLANLFPDARKGVAIHE